MRARAYLSWWLSQAHSFSHRLRVAAVAFGVRSLLDGGVLTLTSLGRAGTGTVAPKYRIKRVDRLLGSSALQSETDDFCRWLATDILRGTPRPTILIDATPLTGPFSALVAAVAFEGRALPFFWTVHRHEHIQRRTIQKAFLKQLAAVLPKACSPILVTDAGFYTHWFKLIRQLGWDFVGRVRGKTSSRQAGEAWQSTTRFFGQARLTARDLGMHEVSRSHPMECRLVLVRQRLKPGPKKRRDTNQRKPGPPKKNQKRTGLSQTEANSKHRKSAEEPWLLATSLDSDATWVAAHYKTRMQIEETFRQLKTERFGWALDRARSKSPHRWRVLLLIAAIAAVFCTRLGLAAEAAGVHARYQANTVRHRRTLSLMTLGHLVVRDPKCPTNIRVCNAALTTAVA